MYWAYMYLLSRKWRNCLLLILLPKFHESKSSDKYMMLKWVTNNSEHFSSSMASAWMCLCNISQEKLVHCQLSTTCLCNHILSYVTILHQEIVCISCPENLLNHSFECRNSCCKYLWENGELRIKYLKNKQMQIWLPTNTERKRAWKTQSTIMNNNATILYIHVFPFVSCTNSGPKCGVVHTNSA